MEFASGLASQEVREFANVGSVRFVKTGEYVLADLRRMN